MTHLIITSNINFILTAKEPDEPAHTGYIALGHEIHISRYIVLDMLHNKYINNNTDRNIATR